MKTPGDERWKLVSNAPRSDFRSKDIARSDCGSDCQWLSVIRNGQVCLILNIGSDCGSDCQLLDGVWLILNFAENEWSGVLDIEYWILDVWPSIALGFFLYCFGISIIGSQVKCWCGVSQVQMFTCAVETKSQ